MTTEDDALRANNTIKIRYLEKEHADDPDNVDPYHPAFTNQLFGEEEKLPAVMEGVQVRLYQDKASFATYLAVAGPGASAMREKILEWLPGGVVSSMDDFLKQVREDRKPTGTKVHEYSRGDRVFGVYETDFDDGAFRSLHKRLQVNIMWFIDGGSYLELDDPEEAELWKVIAIWEQKGSTHYLVGYATLYKFYRFPANFRVRISQVLVLPPDQRQGHGTELLQAAYRFAARLKDIGDIVVEDASDSLRDIRELVDTQNILENKLWPGKDNINEEVTEATVQALHLYKPQIRICHEILWLRDLLASGADERDFRLSIKKRIFQGAVGSVKKDKEKLEPKDEVKEYLEEAYAEEKERYLKIIGKLPKAQK